MNSLDNQDQLDKSQHKNIVKNICEISELVSEFSDKYGIEEAGRFLSKMLLGLAYASNAEEIHFEDKMLGTVIIKTDSNEKHMIH